MDIEIIPALFAGSAIIERFGKISVAAFAPYTQMPIN
jgi:hypothetical protein